MDQTFLIIITYVAVAIQEAATSFFQWFLPAFGLFFFIGALCADSKKQVNDFQRLLTYVVITLAIYDTFMIYCDILYMSISWLLNIQLHPVLTVVMGFLSGFWGGALNRKSCSFK